MSKEDNKREIAFLTRAFCIETVLASSVELIDEDRAIIQLGLYVLFSFMALAAILASRYQKASLLIICPSFLLILAYSCLNASQNPLPLSVLIFILLINISARARLSHLAALSALSLAIFVTYADNADILPYIAALISVLSINVWRKKIGSSRPRISSAVNKPDPLRSKIDCLAENFRLINLGKAAGGIIHDLSNPLTSISLALDMIEKSGNDKKSRKIAKQAKVSANRMMGLINILKSDMNDDCSVGRFSANQEITRSIQSMRLQADFLKAKICFCPNCQIRLLGSQSKFGQIISNIIANSLEAVKEEKTKNIYINLWRDRDSYCLIAISDSGPGLRTDNNPFEAFFSTKKGQGCHLGLGLTVAKRLVESDFKGEIRAESCHCGARFIIKLPIAG